MAGRDARPPKLWWFFILPLFISSTLFAQSRTTCGLTGTVQDENDSPLQGAKVEIESVALIASPQTAVTDSQGHFRFLDLPPGLYAMQVMFDRYKTARIEAIRFSAGSTLNIPVRMLLSAGGQSITVRAESTSIDPTASSFSTVLPKEYLQSMPADRDTTHILDFAPGINIESAYGGAEESGTAYQIDGVDISDPQAGEPWSFFNYSLVDEVELIGLGAPAEYGQFTGAVYNIITKSGSNKFSGSIESFYSDRALTASNSEFVGLFPTVEKYIEQNFQTAGPILRDKLWYFAAAQYVRGESSEGGPIETEKDPRLFLKLTWQANPKNTLQGWLEWDHTRVIGRDADAFTPLEATTGENNPEVVGNLSWRLQISQDSVLSVAWGGYSGRRRFDPHSGFSIPGHEDAQTGFASENARQFGAVDRDRNQINASFSHYARNFLSGYHFFKVGTEFERSEVHDRFGFPGGAFFIDNEGPEEDPTTRKDDFFTLGFFGGDFEARGDHQRISLFVEDSWQITPRLTLNPGVRVDVNRGSVSEGNTVFRTHGLAPRIGFAWDLGAGRSILRAHYGRYYEALYASFYYYMDPGAFAPLTIERVFNQSGFSETLLKTSGQQYAMDPDIKHPYLDQYIVGLDHQLGNGIVLRGTLVYRRNSDFIETVSRDGIFVPVNGIVPETGQHITLFEYLNPERDVLLYTNPPGLHRTYRAIMLSAVRRFDGKAQLYASYVYSRTRGNIDNLGFDEFGTGGNTPFFDGHFLDTPNSLVNAQGRLTHDQAHQVKLQGTYVFVPLNLSISANYTYHSGDTWTPRSDCLLTDDGNGVIGDGILDCHEFPQGPFLYFAEPRGSRRLPARNELDLRVEWEHDVGAYVIGIHLDVFNVTNQIRATEVESVLDEEFGQPATLSFPRNARLGLSLSW